MSWLYRKITTGIGLGLSGVGTAAGIGTSVVIGTIYGAPAVVVGASVAAPVACAYNFLVGKANLDQRQQIEDLKQQVSLLGDDREKREEQLQEQDEQIRKLWDIQSNLRIALRDLAIAGDTFTQFGPILNEHDANLAQAVDRFDTQNDRLDETLNALDTLKSKLEEHIHKDRGLALERELRFCGDAIDLS